ncbi:MAG: Kelch repeat-containing protein [Acidimicrobiales bacterium]
MNGSSLQPPEGAAPLPTPRTGLRTVKGPDGRVYAVGGATDTDGHVTTVEVYDPEADEWAPRSSMVRGRRAPGVTMANDGRILAIGGHGGSDNLIATVEAYDSAADEWTEVAPLTGLALNETAAATGADGRVYAMAPSAKNGAHTFEAYDAGADAWLPLAPPRASYSIGAYAHLVAHSDGRIIAFGANRVLVEAYDPLADRWHYVSHLMQGRWGYAATAAADGLIYAIGGDDGARWPQAVAAVEVYESNRWKAKAPIAVPRALHACVGLDGGGILVVGGYARNGGSSHLVDAVERYQPD